MYRSSPRTFLLVATVLIVFTAVGSAQSDTTIPQGSDVEAAEQARPNLLRDLGLPRDQLQTIRRMNQTRRPEMEKAVRRVRAARGDLDASIYADSLDETLVSVRLRELQLAQNDVVRLRFENELDLRKVLTPGQLSLFKALRKDFEQAREDRQNTKRSRRNGDQRPRRLRQLPRRPERP